MKSKGNLPMTYCPECKGEAGLVIGWKPPQGIDPRLCAFKCASCGSVFYKVVAGSLLGLLRLARKLNEHTATLSR